MSDEQITFSKIEEVTVISAILHRTFADFGGLYVVLMGLFHLLISPWANFNFNLKAIKDLYYVKTKK